MEILSSTKQVMSIMADFLLTPTFVDGVSASLHLAFLFLLFVSWIYHKYWTSERECPKERFMNSKKSLKYKQILITCLCVSAFNLVMCLLSYYDWYENDKNRSKERLITLLNYAIRTISWGFVSVYLHTQFADSVKLKYPSLLRFWWGFYLSVSFYSLVIDFVLYKKHVNLPIQSLVSNITSVLAGFFFAFVGFFAKYKGENSHLEEAFLNGNSRGIENGFESGKPRGDETVTPYSKAGIFSLSTFSWVSPIIALGYKKTLNLDDIPQLDDQDSVVGIFATLRSKIEVDCVTINQVMTLKLAKALFLTLWKEIFWTAVVLLLSTLASYSGPYLIDTFFQYLNGKRLFENEGYLLVSAFFFAKVVECFSQLQWFFKARVIGFKARSALVALIYNKSLTLSCQSKQGQGSGEIINLMAVDAERIGNLSWFLHDPWLLVLQVTLALLILYQNLGLAAISTFVATVLVMLANIPLGKLQEKFQKELMKSKDTRMKSTSEVLRNMRVLKLQGWEMKFLSKITELRKTETGWLRKFLYSSAITSFAFMVAPAFVSVVTFGTCMILEIPLNAGKILAALATFRILQQPIYNLPDTISAIAQAKVSFNRISSFLRLDDLSYDDIERLPRGSSNVAVEINEGNFTWDVSSRNPTLQDISFRVSNGMRVAICGTVGSGKSSLIASILGEIPKISGTVKLCGKRAYVAQSPWIQSGKIEDNILFGEEMDRERYERVLEACSLKKDLEVLPFGDQTIIGERGINLSGGQKQRIQIARALYKDADIYLFDDPFSAVDAHTGTHLFKECLMGMLGSKTVIYVTHQVEFLPTADLILVMKGGRITQAGKYNDILKSGTDFMELVGAHNEALVSLNGTVETTTAEKGDEHEILLKKYDKQDAKSEDETSPTKQLIVDEEREKGKVGISIYWKYITTAYGGALVPVILLAQILFQGLQIGSNYWMAWASPVSEDSQPIVGEIKLILVYVALSIGSSICVLVRTILLVTVGYKTATLLFNKMHECIFRAPMSFFDSTPSGRILNRASTDQSAVDVTIFFQVGTFAFSAIQLLGVIGIMSQVSWQVFAVFVPVVAACIWYQQYYLPSARELTRLAGVYKAPTIQHFSETISGSMTIRSFNEESRFRDMNMKLTDRYSRPKFHIAAAMQWLCLRLNLLCAFTFAFSLLFLISIPEGYIDPGIAGLVVTYGLNLNMLQAVVIWNLCNLENKIISVERILQYTNIPSEPPLVVESNRIDHSWPSHGEVEIRNLQVRYAPHLPLVLRGITCTFHGGMKTGIVGRTGSGKSTLIQTLFRMVDPAAGSIMIDNVDISSIGLHDLRSNLSIIPQDPTMFEGTVRSNLDPLETCTDEQIWEALDKCQLGDEVRKKEGKLDSKVTENGENWSMGQRQLVCLGRVLLKKSKVLVLDEATASVDTATDNLIQQTLREHFSDCTVITIAHRITSVLDSDMILLLSNGLIEEYDSPARLLENNSSSFAQLVAEYSMRSNSEF